MHQLTVKSTVSKLCNFHFQLLTIAMCILDEGIFLCGKFHNGLLYLSMVCILLGEGEVNFVLRSYHTDIDLIVCVTLSSYEVSVFCKVIL